MLVLLCCLAPPRETWVAATVAQPSLGGKIQGWVAAEGTGQGRASNRDRKTKDPTPRRAFNCSMRVSGWLRGGNSKMNTDETSKLGLEDPMESMGI